VRNGEVVAARKTDGSPTWPEFWASRLSAPVPPGRFGKAIGQAVAEDDERIVREWNERHGNKR